MNLVCFRLHEATKRELHPNDSHMPTPASPGLSPLNSKGKSEKNLTLKFRCRALLELVLSHTSSHDGCGSFTTSDRLEVSIDEFAP